MMIIIADTGIKANFSGVFIFSVDIIIVEIIVPKKAAKGTAIASDGEAVTGTAMQNIKLNKIATI